MASRLVGPFSWQLVRSEEMERTYQLISNVISDPGDGPFNVLHFTPGLPSPGDVWFVKNDLDPWAWCTPKATVTPHPDADDGEITTYWRVTQEFSTRPWNRCQDTQIEDPLLESDRVSCSTIRTTKEASFDRFGQPIQNSAWEPIVGPPVEFDDNNFLIRVEQNRAALEMDVWGPMINTVNDAELWGVPARKVKLSSVFWELRYYAACFCYFTRVFEFEVNMSDEGFDKDLPDKGDLVLHGQWEYDDVAEEYTGAWQLLDINGAQPDQNNPLHFDRATDYYGNPRTINLDGRGRPADTHVIAATGTGSGDTDQGIIHVEYYPESNFLLLGIPTAFDCTLRGRSSISFSGIGSISMSNF